MEKNVKKGGGGNVIEISFTNVSFIDATAFAKFVL